MSEPTRPKHNGEGNNVDNTAQGVRVVLAGGGTAGHVNPLLATAFELTKHGAQVSAVGTSEGLETDLVPAAGIELDTIEKVPFPRRPNGAMVRFPLDFRAAVRHAGDILVKRQADVVVGFGGFVSTPMYRAAKAQGIPVVIHEQNAKQGLANRYGARFAAAVALTFPSTSLAAKQGQTVTVGLPLRPAISDLAQARLDGGDAPRRDAAARLGLDPDMTTLVVTGGSLGAQHLNEVVEECLPLLQDFQVLHLTGRGKDGPIRQATDSMNSYHVLDYLATMEDAYAVADLVLCRSGAGTVAELSALGIPAFFVPLAIGNGEQELNAADSIRAGGAVLARDKDFDAQVFAQRVMPLLHAPQKLADMGQAARGVSPVDAAARLSDLVLRIGEES
ncbi:MAG: UDP-N-acetylglucosamine--N-acetylmuramyl-(pentapeptide) pyrophosphoryl-undecaprenol N-acetylglucosamine transferase [Ancrocorticia sp.]|uniref:UDP-N-acetylglucosamine--N-acetylmuramyl- (pentapeptide) pyrophosphoryl-undecaprenol N-acetylglucosamine transferase n=1 Tax=Ancrocorticia sp. TaxID=2593684 RepID=UPI003F93B5A4